MSIRSEIERINANIASAYSILSARGATMPSVLNTNHLAAAIESMPEGGEAMSIETIWEICGYTPPAPGYLPNGYTLLEYIESSGTQYIDTGVVPNQNTRIALDIELLDGSSSTMPLCGARFGQNSDTFSIWYRSYALYPQYGDAAYNAHTISINTLQRLSISMGELKATSNGTTVSLTDSGSFSTQYSMPLLTCNTAGTVDSRKASGKIYSCQIYDNGTIVRQFVPCINPSGEVGLYDLVGAKFYGNAGTGVFTAGASLVEAEYIESNGTQHIDTGFKPNNNTRVVLDAVFPTTPTATMALFGSRVSATDRNYALLYTSSGVFRSDYNNVYTQTWSVAATTRRIYDKDKNTTTIDGTSQSYTNTAFQGAHNLLLLASNNAGTVSSMATMRVYSCQIYDNGTLVRDYVPYLRSDGIYGLYDKANNKFYTNAGTGSFTGA